MLWEGRSLREIREADIRQLVASGLEEHLQLEYKSELYEAHDRGNREFLLDICMFANSSGGILLIGIPERRDDGGQPTGAPDPDGIIGVEVANPEAVLAAYDARVMEAIEERLPLESASIEVNGGRRVLAIRVPNSPNKPHSVRYQGRIYFPARRERQRYSLAVREIKELVMRTASQLSQAEELLQTSFLDVPRAIDVSYLITGIIPVFFEDFLVDVRDGNIHRAMAGFSRTDPPEYRNPDYSFNGLERRDRQFEYTASFSRNALIRVSQQLPLRTVPELGQNRQVFYPAAFDGQLRRFVIRSTQLYEAARISPPFVLGMMLRLQQPLIGGFAAADGLGEEYAQPILATDYRFPFMQVADLGNPDQIIRPFCDQAHQMFGRGGSPNFNANGAWIGRNL